MTGHHPAPVKYRKPWLSVSDQVATLESRGLQITDRTDAESFLRHVNYYRFTGYCLAFEIARDVFSPGVTFEQVKYAYRFDASLRDLFTEGLELIEIDLRTSVAHYFGKKYGAFGHTIPANFHSRFDFRSNHSTWLAKLHEETTRSNELFVSHFRQTYIEYPNLPIWTVTEVMSLGGLSRMIGAMHKLDRSTLASEYGIAHLVLSSAAHHFAYVRNLCAHHCRLWDRIWSIKSDLPNNAEWRGANAVSNRRFFSSLLLMRKLMLRSPQIRAEADVWRDRVNALLKNPPAVAKASDLMGLPANWQSHPAWV